MFADHIEISIRAGKGGDGRSSFLHEKYRAMGGPDGGNGGNGGNVIFAADHNINTLIYFQSHRRIQANDGQIGGAKKSHGKSGKNVVIKVPIGTQVYQDDQKIADLVREDEIIIARGGKGGFGNAHFASSQRQSPRVAEIGEPGEELELRLELKLVAEVGLIGLPNAGKSTLLSVISNAKPQIADYAFTTLVPNLGVVRTEDDSFVVADIPGLIEGASAGKGLGDEFLRHVERTSILLHLIDVHSADPAADWKTIQGELEAYGQGLTGKPQLIVLTKIEGQKPIEVKKLITKLKKLSKTDVLAISAQAHQGLDELLRLAAAKVRAARTEVEENPEAPFVYDLSNVDVPTPWQIEKSDANWLLTGRSIEGFARRTNFENQDSLDRLRDIMQKQGIVAKLERQGLEPGDIIKVAGHDLTW